ncbi:MAG: AAA family ATPase [Bacteroidia bacterium]|nr:AAA family ATPase [Bacteroidia bacterium]
MAQRLIPYGNANFEQIASENYYFVDKTKYIADLEKYKCPVFLRPRRFGKSVFTEMLRWYYDIKAKDRFHEIFDRFYIGKNPTPNHNSYFFLALDFSGMGVWSYEDKDFVKRQFDTKILVDLESFLRRNTSLLNISGEEISCFRTEYSGNATGGLKHVINRVYDNNGKLYIIIDEYDSLTNALAIYYRHASAEENEYLNVLKKGGFFHSFFEAIKERVETIR